MKPARRNPAEDPAKRKLYARGLERLRRARTAHGVRSPATLAALAPLVVGEPPVWRAGGFRSFAEFLARELPGADARTVLRSARVASAFKPADIARFGVSRLEVLLDLLAAQGRRGRLRTGPSLERLAIRLHGDRTRSKALFGELSVAALRRELRAALISAGKAPARPEPDEVRRVRAAFRRSRIDDVSIVLRRGRLTVGDIALSRLAAVGRAMASVRFAEGVTGRVAATLRTARRAS